MDGNIQRTLGVYRDSKNRDSKRQGIGIWFEIAKMERKRTFIKVLCCFPLVIVAKKI